MPVSIVRHKLKVVLENETTVTFIIELRTPATAVAFTTLINISMYEYFRKGQKTYCSNCQNPYNCINNNTVINMFDERFHHSTYYYAYRIFVIIFF